MDEWDTERFFENCLNDFSEIPGMEMIEDTELNRRLLLWLLAKIGFSKYCDRERWTSEVDAYLAEIVDRDFQPQYMTWFDEYSDAVVTFACYAYGALAGMYSAGKLDYEQFKKGVLNLPIYYFVDFKKIYDAYIHGVGS